MAKRPSGAVYAAPIIPAVSAIVAPPGLGRGTKWGTACP